MKILKLWTHVGEKPIVTVVLMHKRVVFSLVVEPRKIMFLI